MSYVSSIEDNVSFDRLGCGPGCNCGPCRSGLSEWYEREEEDEPEPRAPAPAPQKPSTSPPPKPQTLSGWRSGFGFYAPRRFGHFSETPGAAPAFPNVTAQLPVSGPGYVSYYATDSRGRLDDPPGYHRYAIPEVIAALQSIAAQWLRAHPRGPRLQIGDLSLRGGGPTPRHGAHQMGLEADIRPPRRDGQEAPATFRDPNYSRELTQELVNLIRGNPLLRVRVILFNDTAVRGVQGYAGHDNHLHVGFLPPATSQPQRPTPRVRPTPRTRTTATQAGATNIIARTNAIFYSRHPDRRGRPIRSGETQLKTEWLAIRNSLLRGGPG